MLWFFCFSWEEAAGSHCALDGDDGSSSWGTFCNNAAPSDFNKRTAGLQGFGIRVF